MFIEAILISIIVGYVLKGRVRNLESVQLKGLYIVTGAFTIEFINIMLIRKNIINPGTITYFVDLLMYSMLFYFVYLNRKDSFIIIMGAGFLLNALPIFFNGGTMPVSESALVTAGINISITKQGLYTLVSSNTKLIFLSDVIPITVLRHSVVSIGDIVIAIGLALLLITGMKKKEIAFNIEDKII
jgi:hypothetical protein